MSWQTLVMNSREGSGDWKSRPKFLRALHLCSSISGGGRGGGSYSSTLTYTLSGPAWRMGSVVAIQCISGCDGRRDGRLSSERRCSFDVITMIEVKCIFPPLRGQSGIQNRLCLDVLFRGRAAPFRQAPFTQAEINARQELHFKFIVSPGELTNRRGVLNHTGFSITARPAHFYDNSVALRSQKNAC